MTPHAAVDLAERDTLIPSGPGDAFSGYGVIGLTFRSGHVLALRRCSTSSLGRAYTSVWHRDPAGRWTFYSTVAPDYSCARYFGGQVDRNEVTPIDLAWDAPWALRVSIERKLTWQLTMASSSMTRLLSTMTSSLPGRASRIPAVLRSMGVAADATLGTGRMNLTGRTPNGHRFVMHPQQLWLVDASAAHMSGCNLGPLGPLEEQAALEDMRMPQRGLFAVASVRFERPTRGQATAARLGKPCSPMPTTCGR